MVELGLLGKFTVRFWKTFGLPGGESLCAKNLRCSTKKKPSAAALAAAALAAAILAAKASQS